MANPDVVVEVPGIVSRCSRPVGARSDGEIARRDPRRAAVDACGGDYGSVRSSAGLAYRTYARAIEFAPQHVPLYIALASFGIAHSETTWYGMEVLGPWSPNNFPVQGRLSFPSWIADGHRGRPGNRGKNILGRCRVGILQMVAAASGNRSSSTGGRTGGRSRRHVCGSTERYDASDGQALYPRALALSRTSSHSTRPEQINLLERAVPSESPGFTVLAARSKPMAQQAAPRDAINTLKKAVSAASGRNATARLSVVLVCFRKAGQIQAANRQLVRFLRLRVETDADESELIPVPQGRAITRLSRAFKRRKSLRAACACSFCPILPYTAARR